MIDITVAIALYRPNIIWLKEELLSIAKQTYRDFKVIVWNDCPDDLYDYKELFQRCLKEIPFVIYSGKDNLGTTKAFEKLTDLVQTDFIAYADQDDVWLPEKLEVLRKTIKEKKVSLVCSDMYIIDGKSNIVANSISQVRPHQIILNGDNLFEHLITQNFVNGCTVLMKTKSAKEAMPFGENFYHDHWLSLWAAAHEGIYAIKKPLIKYRIYGENQTGVLKGINSKESYYARRVRVYYQRVEELKKRAQNTYSKKSDINYIIEKKFKWAEARCNYFKYPTIANGKALAKRWKNSASITFFELLLPFLPKYLFEEIIKAVQKGKL